MAFPLIIIFSSLILMLICIAFDLKIKLKNTQISLYWIVVLISAFLCIIFGFLDINDLKNVFISSSNINPVKILVIFLSCTSLSVILDEIGFFKYIATIALQKSKSSQKKIFFTFVLIVAILTIFTSNDILILTFTPFICYFTKRANIDATPYIISEFVAANAWSMFFFIDNPTNIYLCSIFGINFIEYTVKMFLPTIVAGIVSQTIVYLLFMKKLNKPITVCDEEVVKPNKTYLSIGLVGLFGAIVLMAVSSYINLQLWYIPLICGALTYIAVFFVTIKNGNGDRKIVFNSLKKLPYPLIPFLISMSIIVASLNNIGFIQIVGDFLVGKGIFAIGILSFLSGNLINNIPMSMLFADILLSFSATANEVFVVVISSNICAFLTPVGALAGIMFMNILKQNDVKLSFAKFMLYGIIISIPTLLSSFLMIYVL